MQDQTKESIDSAFKEINEIISGIEQRYYHEISAMRDLTSRAASLLENCQGAVSKKLHPKDNSAYEFYSKMLTLKYDFDKISEHLKSGIDVIDALVKEGQ